MTKIEFRFSDPTDPDFEMVLSGVHGDLDPNGRLVAINTNDAPVIFDRVEVRLDPKARRRFGCWQTGLLMFECGQVVLAPGDIVEMNWPSSDSPPAPHDYA